ncbi:MAG: hypothetical protein JXQ84_05535 [Rhodospirillaceae bacterium]|nr:hypothetical protein [Rhodospirillaceae bacterium]
MLALATWRGWSLCRALGAGGLITGFVEWGMGQSSAPYQLGMCAGLTLIAFIGGRRMQGLDRALPSQHYAGVGLVGRTATVTAAFQKGHGCIMLDGHIHAATGPSDLWVGAEVKIVGCDDEALKVMKKR